MIQDRKEDEEVETRKGFVEHIIYKNPMNGYGVINLIADEEELKVSMRPREIISSWYLIRLWYVVCHIIQVLFLRLQCLSLVEAAAAVDVMTRW